MKLPSPPLLQARTSHEIMTADAAVYWGRGQLTADKVKGFTIGAQTKSR